MINCNPISFTNYGALLARVPDNVFAILKNEINEIRENINSDDYKKANRDLAGNIEKEFYLKKSMDSMEPVVLDIAEQYIKYFDFNKKIPNISGITSTQEYKLGDLWVNFQKKHEFNPLHWHSGIFSFVIWVNIPYDIKEELSLDNSKNSNIPMTTAFNFVYTDVLGEMQVHAMFAEKMHEGGLLFFPAKLNHQVWPFYTSEDYRITVSGNIFLKEKENK